MTTPVAEDSPGPLDQRVRRRADLSWRIWPDGAVVYDPLSGDVHLLDNDLTALAQATPLDADLPMAAIARDTLEGADCARTLADGWTEEVVTWFSQAFDDLLRRRILRSPPP
ncbi:HPr-rel-A system PqqD family peptide chaperone [Rhodospirillum rubrum]|uniref:HPr-rel-A system PqqD family peptide chaperone n=1 Tax=Rhodospirillum rubrum TaxID=1085 RepID=UPI00003C2A6B|nr:HPr-rel-A system PqqD family peptide chaperone [Rhodospirillum rubrum]